MAPTEKSPVKKPSTAGDDFRAVDLYRQAAGIIAEKGFEATSMSDIAEAVDLSRGCLFYYIKGKRTLLFAIMNYALDLLETEVLNPARREKDPGQRLSTLIANHVELVIEEAPIMTTLVTEDEDLEGTHRSWIRQRRRVYVDFLRDTITAVLQRQDRVPQIDPTLAAYSVLGLINWVVRWYRKATTGRPTREEVTAQLTLLALHGLIPPPPSGAA
ncbi:MAG: TetR/AcrR family transcriptional regulator [bacterium]|nr:TetR/AcrR family transcriptional regulator [bacterium]